MARVRVEVPVEPESTAPAPNNKPSLPKVDLSRFHVTTKKLMWVVFAVLVFVILLLVADRHRLEKQAATAKDPQKQSQNEATTLKNEVSKVYDVPNETPTLATVVDSNKLKGQSFFVDAQNGDKVLLFTKAKKAILYRPSTKKVINAAPINIGNSTATPGVQSPAISK